MWWVTAGGEQGDSTLPAMGASPGGMLLPSPPTLRGTGCWGAAGCNTNRKAGRDPSLPSWGRKETHWVVLGAQTSCAGGCNGDTQALNRAHPRVPVLPGSSQGSPHPFMPLRCPPGAGWLLDPVNLTTRVCCHPWSGSLPGSGPRGGSRGRERGCRDPTSPLRMPAQCPSRPPLPYRAGSSADGKPGKSRGQRRENIPTNKLKEPETSKLPGPCSGVKASPVPGPQEGTIRPLLPAAGGGGCGELPRLSPGPAVPRAAGTSGWAKARGSCLNLQPAF